MLGMGMDLPLLDWLNTYTFKTEAAFKDTDYARGVYQKLAREMIANGTTRVCAFSSLHRESTMILMEEFEKAGMTGCVGKVNMDRNSGDVLTETTEESIRETERWLDEAADKFEHIKPILTPRFTPTCSDALMAFLGRLAQEKICPCSRIYRKILRRSPGLKSCTPIVRSIGKVIKNSACLTIKPLWRIASIPTNANAKP